MIRTPKLKEEQMNRERLTLPAISVGIVLLLLAACALPPPEFPTGRFVSANGVEALQFDEDGSVKHFVGRLSETVLARNVQHRWQSLHRREDDWRAMQVSRNVHLGVRWSELNLRTHFRGWV